MKLGLIGSEELWFIDIKFPFSHLLLIDFDDAIERWQGGFDEYIDLLQIGRSGEQLRECVNTDPVVVALSLKAELHYLPTTIGAPPSRVFSSSLALSIDALDALPYSG